MTTRHLIHYFQRNCNQSGRKKFEGESLVKSTAISAEKQSDGHGSEAILDNKVTDNKMSQSFSRAGEFDREEYLRS